MRVVLKPVFKNQEALLFLKKKEQKNFYHWRAPAVIASPCEAIHAFYFACPEHLNPQAILEKLKKFFWFFLFTKRTPSLLGHPA